MLLRLFISVVSRQWNIIQWCGVQYIFSQLWVCDTTLIHWNCPWWEYTHPGVRNSCRPGLLSWQANLCCCSVTVMSDSLATPWTITYPGPVSMGFSRQEYWSQLPFPFPGDFPDREIKLMSPTLAGRFCTPEPPGKPWATSTSPHLRGQPHLSRYYWFCTYLQGHFPLPTSVMLWY